MPTGPSGVKVSNDFPKHHCPPPSAAPQRPPQPRPTGSEAVWASRANPRRSRAGWSRAEEGGAQG
jgi:hypothetical protein